MEEEAEDGASSAKGKSETTTEVSHDEGKSHNSDGEATAATESSQVEQLRKLVAEKNKEIRNLKKVVARQRKKIERLQRASDGTSDGPSPDEKSPARASRKKKRKAKDTDDSDEAAAAAAAAPKKKRKTNRCIPFVTIEGETKSEKMLEYEKKLESKWNVRMQELADFKTQFGHCNVPKRYEPNTKLARFVLALRHKHTLHSSGQRVSALFIRDVDRLREMGFDFGKDRASALRDSWNDRVQDLVEYKEQHGDCLVSCAYKENPKLANWVAYQRRNYKAVQAGATVPALSAERIEQLNSLGFVWALQPSPKDGWNSQYESLKLFKGQFGHCRPPKNYESNRSLHTWVQNQRTFYQNFINDKEGTTKLSSERIAKLQLIGFEWEVATDIWETLWEARFRELITYKAENGDCRVPKVYKANTKLANWVHEHRKYYKRMQEGKGRKGLTDERIRRLEEIGFEWSVLAKKSEVGERYARYDY